MRVPVDLITVIGRSHINRSLKTSTLREAQRAMMAVGHDLERFFDSARNGGSAALQRREAIEPSPLPAIQSQPRVKTQSEY